MKIITEYFRVPSSFKHIKKGKPVYWQRYKRSFTGKAQGMPNVCPRGGACRVIVVAGEREFVGESECSMSDNFSYDIGKKIAMERALSKVADAILSV